MHHLIQASPPNYEVVTILIHQVMQLKTKECGVFLKYIFFIDFFFSLLRARETNINVWNPQPVHVP